jgi:hypothetical protein
MFDKRSRYAQAQAFEIEKSKKTVPFKGILPRSIPVTQGVIEHTVSEGERLDHLAKHYYNDDRLWWRIVDANPEVIYSGFLLDEKMKGRVIAIPTAQE